MMKKPVFFYNAHVHTHTYTHVIIDGGIPRDPRVVRTSVDITDRRNFLVLPTIGEKRKEEK